MQSVREATIRTRHTSRNDRVKPRNKLLPAHVILPIVRAMLKEFRFRLRHLLRIHPLRIHPYHLTSLSDASKSGDLSSIDGQEGEIWLG
jgi:hypothetical protein